MKLIVAMLLASCSLTTSAQVYRCTTPTGGTEYSQFPCGKDAKLLQSQENSIDTKPSRSPLDALREQDRASQAYENAYRNAAARSNTQSRQTVARRQVDSVACERSDRDAKIEAGHARKDAAAIKRAQQVADADCGRDIRDTDGGKQIADTLSDPSPSAARPLVEPPVAYQEPQRRTLTNCDATGCYDNQGARYNNMGQNFMGPTGMCRKTLLGWSCP